LTLFGPWFPEGFAFAKPSGNHGHPKGDNHALRACIKNKVFDRLKTAGF